MRAQMAAPSPDTSTRDRVILEAARQFARHGYEGASLRGIADAVGIRAASIFHHFPGGKVQLYDAIFETVTDLVAARLAEQFRPGPDPVDAVVQLSGMFWDMLAERADIATLLLRDAFDAPGREHAFLDVVDEIVTSARAYLGQMQAAGRLGAFDPSFFMLWSATYCVTFHGAPGFRRRVIGDDGADARVAKQRYLDAVRGFVAPP